MSSPGKTQPELTDRTHILQSLDSESIFRTLVGAVTDYAIFVLDPEGHVATWNQGAQRFKGYLPEEIIGKHFSVFYPEAEKAAGKPQHELEVAGRVGRFEDEGWRIRKDGTRFWANVIITRIVNSEGKLLGFGKITRDLTERRQSELQYRLLVDAVTDYAIFSLSPEGIVRSWNSGAQRIKGYSAEEIIGQHFSRFYTPEDAQSGLPDRLLNRAATEGHVESEGWRVRKDGTRFWSSVVLTALRDEEGTLTGFSKITRDITDRMRLLQQIRSHAAELEVQIAEREQTNAELEAFSYSVSHDLRAPLRAIEGFAEALIEDYGNKLDAIGRDYLDEITRASTRMNRLVQDLLNYSRLARVDLALGPVNCAVAVSSAISEVTAAVKNVTVAGEPGLAVMAHEPTLVQALVNLISNGLKFQAKDADPRVEVSWKQSRPGFISIDVQDHGIGIAPEHQDRIFRVFERLHGAEEYPGTGIGLAIVKRSIERMHGDCQLESQVGKGSKFSIELPEVRGTR